MKVVLPENQSEITLGQYQELTKLMERTDLDSYEFARRKLKIFTPLNYQQISQIKQTDLEDMIATIDKALGEEAKFQQTFKMNDVEFGFIPNFDDMRVKEYFDLTTYQAEIDNLHKLMSILFRPIVNKIFGSYEIVEYNGSREWAEAMKQTPLSIVNGALVFFSDLAKDLLNYIQRSMDQELMRETQMFISKSGAGLHQSTGSQEERYGDRNLS